MFSLTPRAIISIIAAVFLLLLGGWAGYSLGSHGKEKLQQELAHDVSVGKVIDTAHNQVVEQLKVQNVALQKSYDDLKTQKAVEKAASDKAWQDMVAKKDAALQIATQNSTKAQVQVNSLKASLFLATTPEEKLKLQAQLDDAQKQLAVLQARTDGLKCLSVPIPKEYADAANGEAK